MQFVSFNDFLFLPTNFNHLPIYLFIVCYYILYQLPFQSSCFCLLLMNELIFSPSNDIIIVCICSYQHHVYRKYADIQKWDTSTNIVHINLFPLYNIYYFIHFKISVILTLKKNFILSFTLDFWGRTIFFFSSLAFIND